MDSAEPNPHRVATDSMSSVGVSSSRLARRIRWSTSHCTGDTPVSARNRRVKVRTLTRAWTAICARMIGWSSRSSIQPVPMAPDASLEATRVWMLERLDDVLRLTAATVWRHYQLAGDPVGDRRAVVMADQVQAQVDPCRHARRGEHLAVVDVQGSRVDPDRR